MSARFHPYLCGRKAAEWLINMEKELFLSGYCRALDQSRMVAVEIDGELAEADCAWPDCPYAPQCQVAAKIREATEA